jgi:anion-transporting  ArsA/GET3 family ATPase
MKKSVKVYFFVGSGGVGKTTTAAGFALALEKSGLRVAVMTVDPARRLAQALGLEKLSNEAQLVRSSHPTSYLDALWLNNENALQDLARKHIESPQNLERIIAHPFFKVIENQLGGVEEYLGVEKALSLVDSGRYDVCVIDTPPSQHALDFLESPRHLQDFFDDTVLKHFVQESGAEQAWWQKLFHFGQAQAMEVFKRVVGKSFFSELAELLKLLRPVYESLRDTAAEAEKLFASTNTDYVLVSTPEEDPLKEADFLLKSLQTKYPRATYRFVLNRCLPSESPPAVEALAQAFGDERARILAERWAAEQGRIQDALAQKSTLSAARLPRFSLRHLGISKLECLGEEVLKQWNAQSANGSPPR